MYNGYKLWPIALRLLIISLSSNLYEANDVDSVSNPGEVMSEKDVILEIETKYVSHYYLEWKKSSSKISDEVGLMSSNSSKDHAADLGLPSLFCYQCYGMLTSKGERIGCTEAIETVDFKFDNKMEYIVPCRGFCIFTRNQQDDTVTFVRDCYSNYDYQGVPICKPGNRVCFHSCQTHLCNRDLPANFTQPGGAAGRVHQNAVVFAITLALQFFLALR